MNSPLVALGEYLDARIMLRALKPGTPRWQKRLIRIYWAMYAGTAERQLALCWLPSRYRLMAADTENGPWVERVREREINGKRIPIATRREGERRRAEFLQRHPDCVARLERAQ